MHTNKVAFTKAHGCGNDFLIVPRDPADFDNPEEFVRAICDRHFGIGADGVYFLCREFGEVDAEIHLYNSDGSPAELSGNGTRCVAAVLAHDQRRTAPALLRIRTGAGVKELRLIEQNETRYRFEMCVGPASIEPGPDGTLAIWLGNPQCVVFVDGFEMDWARRGRELGQHPHFPHGTNVDFVRVRDPHHIEARFWERGAGHTLASGTGSTASAIAAIHAGRATSPVTVHTEGGELEVAWEPGSDAYLTGPAELICRGEFYWPKK